MGHLGRKIPFWAKNYKTRAEGARFRKFSPPFQTPKTPSEVPPDLIFKHFHTFLFWLIILLIFTSTKNAIETQFDFYTRARRLIFSPTGKDYQDCIRNIQAETSLEST